MFKDASLQSESTPDRPDAVPVDQIGLGLPETPPSPKPQESRREKSREALKYQHLPVRNTGSSNYGFPAHYEFQTEQNLHLDPSSAFPVLSFDEAISDLTNEMDLSVEDIPQSNNATLNQYPQRSTHFRTGDNSEPFAGVTTHPGFSGCEKLVDHALRYANRSQSHMSQMAKAEEPQYVAGEGWNFSDMSSPDDFYDMRANIGHAGQDASKR